MSTTADQIPTATLGLTFKLELERSNNFFLSLFLGYSGAVLIFNHTVVVVIFIYSYPGL